MPEQQTEPQAPRMINKVQLAAYLGMSRSTLRHKLPGLEARGFPDKIPGLDRYDLNAVNDWLDRAGGVSKSQIGLKRSERAKNAFK